KSLSQEQKRWLKRRQAIEPLIGHTKQDHGMQRCWLKGSEGDALHAVLCAAGFNIRWLMRALLRQFSVSGLKHVFLGLMALWATLLNGLAAHLRAKAMPQRHPQARQALPSLLRRWPNGLVAAA
ncbi:transposase, partial [Roseateles sp. LYH14W]